MTTRKSKAVLFDSERRLVGTVGVDFLPDAIVYGEAVYLQNEDYDNKFVALGSVLFVPSQEMKQ
jgi:hypothetical protein